MDRSSSSSAGRSQPVREHPRLAAQRAAAPTSALRSRDKRIGYAIYTTAGRRAGSPAEVGPPADRRGLLRRVPILLAAARHWRERRVSRCSGWPSASAPAIAPRLLARVLAVLERIELRRPARRTDVGVIVVDNRPDGQARGAVRAGMRARLPMRAATSSRKRGRASRSRATVRWPRHRARGADFVAFLDDDDVPEPDWLLALAAHAARDRRRSGVRLLAAAVATCSCRAGCATPAISARREPDDRNRYGLPAWAGTYNVLASRRLLERLAGPDGPFRHEFAHSGGEDSDLFIRAKEPASPTPVPPIRSWCAPGSRTA